MKLPRSNQVQTVQVTFKRWENENHRPVETTAQPGAKIHMKQTLVAGNSFCALNANRCSKTLSL